MAHKALCCLLQEASDCKWCGKNTLMLSYNTQMLRAAANVIANIQETIGCKNLGLVLRLAQEGCKSCDTDSGTARPQL